MWLSGEKRLDRQPADLPSAEQRAGSDWLTRLLSSCKTSQRKNLGGELLANSPEGGGRDEVGVAKRWSGGGDKQARE